MSSWADVATIGKAKNLKGGLLVYPREGLPFLLEEGMEVTFVPPVLRTPRVGRVVDVMPQTGDAHLVFFDSIDSIDLAERLQSHHCLVRRSDLPEDFDRGLHDLAGFQLIGADGEVLGAVTALEDNPAHSLLVVRIAGEDRVVRVPFVEEFVCSIDEDAATIHANLPEGLLDL